MRKTPRTAKAKALLRAERQRARKAAGPQQGNLWSNPDYKPTSSKGGPKGSPLYDADQKEFVRDPKHKKVKKAPDVPGVKKPAGGPSPSPLYDANQTDLTEPKFFHGKPQDKLKAAGRIGVIERIRRSAANPYSVALEKKTERDLDNLVNNFVKKLKSEIKDLKARKYDSKQIKGILKKRYDFLSDNLLKKIGL